MIGQYFLTSRRHDEARELLRGKPGPGDHRQAVVGANGEFIRQRYDLLARILLARRLRVCAIGQENIGTPLGDMPAIGSTSRWWLCARSATGELERFLSKRAL